MRKPTCPQRGLVLEIVLPLGIQALLCAVLPVAPRLLAKRKVNAKAEPSNQSAVSTLLRPSEAEIGTSDLGLPVSTEILDSENLAVLATHCNERKYSAKLCSVSFTAFQAPPCHGPFAAAQVHHLLSLGTQHDIGPDWEAGHAWAC